MPPESTRRDQSSTTAVAGEGTLVTDREIDGRDLLDVLTRRCVQSLDIAAAAVILADPDGGLRVAAASSPRSRLLEVFAVAAETGPCVDALRTGAQVACPHIDLDTDPWPGFAVAARDAGFRGAHALPLRHHEEVIGALTLLDTEPRTLTALDRDLAQTLADAAALALVDDRTAHRSPRKPR